MFCLHPILQQFHGLFISCNEPLDYTRWCSKCEKCAFVFLLMSAFLSPPAVWAVFGDDLFQKTDMLPVFLQLVGAGEKKEKPFECVGTFAEAKAAAELACRQCTRHVQKWAHGARKKLPPVLECLIREIGLQQIDETAPTFLEDDGSANDEVLLRFVDDVWSAEGDEVVSARVLSRWIDTDKSSISC